VVDQSIRVIAGQVVVLEPGRRIGAFVFVEIHLKGEPDLPQVRGAGDFVSRLAGALERGEQDGDQQRDDANDDEQLDEGESSDLLC
jgi:hypothetical protein